MTVIKHHVGLSGKFRATLLRSKSGTEKASWSFDNLITDAGLNAIGTGPYGMSSYITYCGVGTGSSDPDEADTSLDTALGARTNSSGGIADVTGFGSSYAYSYLRRTRLFLEGEVNGNLAEVGMFRESTGGTMWTRQLFRDSEGDPVVITKTSNEQLRIEYELRVYHPEDDTVELDLGGNTIECLTRAVQISTASVWGYNSNANAGVLLRLGSWPDSLVSYWYETNAQREATSAPLGNQTSTSTPTWSTYVTDSFYRDGLFQASPSSANWTDGVGGLLAGPWYAPGLFTTFTPKIPKTDLERLKVTVRYSWGRQS